MKSSRYKPNMLSINASHTGWWENRCDKPPETKRLRNQSAYVGNPCFTSYTIKGQERKSTYCKQIIRCQTNKVISFIMLRINRRHHYVVGSNSIGKHKSKRNSIASDRQQVEYKRASPERVKKKQRNWKKQRKRMGRQICLLSTVMTYDVANKNPWWFCDISINNAQPTPYTHHGNIMNANANVIASGVGELSKSRRM